MYMERYNLLVERWIPVQTHSQKRLWVRPCDIVATENPVIAIDWNRADFNAATLEFLIGLLQTCFAPKNEAEWRNYYAAPPSVEDLQTAFQRYEEAFYLNGEGYRFMQDPTAAGDVAKKDDWEPMTKLLIDAPGGNTIKENKDHFVKRTEGGFSLPVAAIALYTLQTYAPSGGQGHRTSIRGGGPMTTILLAIEPRNSTEKPTLWRTLWMNVLPQSEIDSLPGNPDKNSIGDIFPWMQPVRLSKEKNSEVIPDMANPLLPLWGTPRRIYLDFTTLNTENLPCLVEGERRTQALMRYSTQNYGENYPTNLWEHPLSPYYFDKKQHLPEHPQPGGIRWKYWLGCVGLQQKEDDILKRPARVVRYFRTRRSEEYPEWLDTMRVSAFGYDMKNMEARCWYAGEMPVILNEMDEGRVRTILIQSIDAATEAAQMLNRYTTAFFYDTQAQFWAASEQPFFEHLKILSNLVREAQQQPNPEAWIDEHTNSLNTLWFLVLRGLCFSIVQRLAESYPPEGVKAKQVYQQVGEFQKWFTVNIQKTLGLSKDIVQDAKEKKAKEKKEKKASAAKANKTSPKKQTSDN
jgi:CRISPR system Cascade subunit CasA